MNIKKREYQHGRSLLTSHWQLSVAKGEESSKIFISHIVLLVFVESSTEVGSKMYKRAQKNHRLMLFSNCGLPLHSVLQILSFQTRKPSQRGKLGECIRRWKELMSQSFLFQKRFVHFARLVLLCFDERAFDVVLCLFFLFFLFTSYQHGLLQNAKHTAVTKRGFRRFICLRSHFESHRCSKIEFINSPFFSP